MTKKVYCNRLQFILQSFVIDLWLKCSQIKLRPKSPFLTINTKYIYRWKSMSTQNTNQVLAKNVLSFMVASAIAGFAHAESTGLALEEVLVTGLPTQQTKMDASVSSTTLSPERVENSVARSTTEIFLAIMVCAQKRQPVRVIPTFLFAAYP